MAFPTVRRKTDPWRRGSTGFAFPCDMPFVSPSFAMAFLVATATLLGVPASRAGMYTEVGDAGDLPATAQVVSGAAGTSLTSISGQTTLTNKISDSDMFEIYISSPSSFSASTTGFAAGANNFDTQLALFTASGVGVIANDDAASGGEQSTLPAGSLTLGAGDYYLLLSGSGRYAATSTGALVFPNYHDGTTASTATVPANTNNPIAEYTGNSSEAGNYVIALTGAQFVSTVPEPGVRAVVLAGAAALGFCRWTRRALFAKR